MSNLPKGVLMHSMYQQVIEIDDFVTVKRGWLERLFSLPWNPLTKTKTIDNPNAPKVGEGWSDGNRFYVRRSDAHHIYQTIREYNES